MLADRVGEVAEPLAEPLDRRQVGIRLDPRAKALDQRLEAGDIEPLLAAEVLEDQPVRDARGVGDLIDRDLVVVAIAEDLERGGDQLQSALAGPLGCQRSGGDGARVVRVDSGSTPSSGCLTAGTRC
jgi:hypothetical protein